MSLVLYEDAFRIIPRYGSKEPLKDHMFSDVLKIKFNYPKKKKNATLTKFAMILLMICLIFIPFFSGDIDFSLNEEIVEVQFCMKDGNIITVEKKFNSIKKAKQFESNLVERIAKFNTI